MTRRERIWRLGLALAYSALTVWAQAGDRHGHSAPQDVDVACDAGCRDPRPHYSGHPTPVVERDAGDCLACQSRANVLTTLPEAPALGDRNVETVVVAEPTEPTVLALGIPSSRGPPSA